MPVRPRLGTALALARMGVGFLWWSAVAAIVIVVVLAALSPWPGDESSFIVSAEVGVSSLPLTPDGRIGGVDVRGSAGPTLEDVRATLEYSPEGAGTWALSTGPLLFLISLWMFAIHQARALLKDVSIDQVFTEVNANRVSRIGWVLLATAILLRPAQWWTTYFALRDLGLEGQGLYQTMDTNGWLSHVIVGLLVLVLGQVWRHGVELERDQQLTV